MSMELVVRHHAEQKLIARQTVAELAPLWNILEFHNIRGTEADWLRAVRPVVEKGFLTSQYVAAEFVRSYRSAVFPSSQPLTLEMPNPFNAFGTPAIPDKDMQLRIMVAMKVTGSGWVMKNSSPLPEKNPEAAAAQEADLMRRGFSKSAGAATRLVLNGGRAITVLIAHADQLALGVKSLTDEEGCTSCTWLMENPIPKSAGLKKMQAMAVGHDFCKCSAYPWYDA